MKDPQLHRLLELFGQEQACYTRLLDQSRSQRTLIDAGDADGLLRILADKQHTLARMQRIEDELAPAKDQWIELRHRLDEGERELLDDALSTVEQLLAEVIAAERHCEQKLLARRVGQGATGRRSRREDGQVLPRLADVAGGPCR